MGGRKVSGVCRDFSLQRILELWFRELESLRGEKEEEEKEFELWEILVIGKF